MENSENMVPDIEKKASLLATKISGLNNFLFWFGKKIYSFLLGIVFIVFVGAGVYAVFVGGDAISIPSFDDDPYENLKEVRLEEMEKKKAYDKLSEEEKEKLVAKAEQEEIDAEKVSSGRKDLEDKYGEDIEDFIKKHNYNEKFYEFLIEKIGNKPEDRRDDWFYGFIKYMDDGYEYFSKDDVYEMFREENGWTEKWDVNNWLGAKYDEEYGGEVRASEQSEASAEATRMLSLQVMGASFGVFLIVVLIAIFIQIEANTRPENRDRT